jgi:hypothetical protein
MRKTAIAASAALAILAMPFVADAAQTQRAEFGTLTCNVEGGVGLIVGSSKGMTCSFAPADGRQPQQFVGRVNKLGLDVGVTGATVVKWLVLAPTGSTMPASALAGTYAGVSAEASAAIGVGANVLVGGSSDSFALQPLSVQGQTGVNVAAGITQFKLEAI